VSVVHHDGVDLDRPFVEAKLGPTVEQFLHGGHKDAVRVQELIRQIVIGSASRNAKLPGLLAGLSDQEVIGAQIHHRAFAGVEA
jgi:hypothetical protein